MAKKTKFAAVAAIALATAFVGPAMADPTDSPDCDSSVLTAQRAAQDSYINGQIALAAQNFAGLPNGMGFSQLSCLDNLLKGGLNVIFEPPSLDGIINTLIQQVCNKAQQYVQEAEQPIMQAVSSASGAANGSGGVLSDIVPGYNLGGALGGVRVGSGGNGVTTNLGPLLSSSPYSVVTGGVNYNANDDNFGGGIFGR